MNSTYSVTTTRGCKVITNPIPVIDVTALITAWCVDNEWYAAGDISNKIGASLVVGPMDELQKWREELDLT